MVLVLPAILLVFAAALDISKLNAQKRYTQAQADLSALSAVRRLPDTVESRTVAGDVVRRNTGFGRLDLRYGDVRFGHFTYGSGFVAAMDQTSPGPVDAVTVVVRSPYEPILLRPFLREGNLWVVREAVAMRRDPVSLTLRNALLRLNSGNSPLLRALLGDQLNLNLNLISWEGLVGTQLSLNQLAGLISTNVGAELLTFGDALNAEVGLGQLLRSISDLGVVPAAAVRTLPDVKVRLGDLLNVTPDIAALQISDHLPDIGVSALDLLTAMGQFSGMNSHHLIDLDVGVNLPPLADVKVGVDIVDPGVTVIGLASGPTPLVAEASQIIVTAAGNVAGLVRLDIELRTAAARARLIGLNCRASAPDDIVAWVDVETHPITLMLRIFLLEKPNGKPYTAVSPVSFAGHTHRVAIRLQDVGKVVLVPNTIAISELTNAVNLGLDQLSRDLTSDRGALGPLLGALLGPLLGLINGLLSSISQLLANLPVLDGAVQALLDLLGIRVAQAELILNSYDCGTALVH